MYIYIYLVYHVYLVYQVYCVRVLLPQVSIDSTPHTNILTSYASMRDMNLQTGIDMRI